jgi:uncharacterized RDD family membrane protein YckC
MMSEYQWISPEKVKLNFNLAGVGSRFAAILIDTGFQGILLTAVFYLGFDFIQMDSAWITAAIFVGYFAIFYGYFILFETLWNGQTPGKRIINLRVIQADGSSVTFSKVLIRNILRVIDSLPFIYGVGIISVFASEKKQRLGDMAAGTVVIKENLNNAPAAMEFQVREMPWTDTARLSIHKVTEEEFAVLKKYLLRRPALNLDEIVAWDRKLTLFFAEKLGISSEEAGNPQDFLAQIAALYQNR